MKIGSNFKALQANFFDSKLVKSKVDKAKRKNFSKFGAFTRKTARQSLRRRKRSAAAGEVPSIHSPSSQSLKFILFAYEPTSESVIVGPVKFGNRRRGFQTSKTGAELQEEGGSATITEAQIGSRWAPIDALKGRAVGKRTRRRSVTYAPRPYMQPAFNKEKKNAAHAWLNSVVP